MAEKKRRQRAKELAKEFDETSLRLRQLQAQKDEAQRMILTPEQEAEIQEFEGDRPCVSSMGADREPGTGDDVYLD